jgi:hypothetical protein
MNFCVSLPVFKTGKLTQNGYSLLPVRTSGAPMRAASAV